MSYFDQAQDPRRRRVAIAGAAAVHALLAYALLTGLSYDHVVETLTNPKGVFVDDLPLPPPPPDPAPSPRDATDTPLQGPLPPLPLPPTPGPTVAVDDFLLPPLPPAPTPTMSAEPSPSPRPAPSFTPRAAQPGNDPARWITPEDYPRASLLDGSEGLARYRVVIGTNGRVASCEIVTSTGDRRLDEATCRFIRNRARFEPATDETGAKVLGTYSGSVRWQIPG